MSAALHPRWYHVLWTCRYGFGPVPDLIIAVLLLALALLAMWIYNRRQEK